MSAVEHVRRAPPAQPADDMETAPGMLYSHELAERVNLEAEDATRLPWWFWEAAVVVFVGVVVISSVFPWGWA